MAKPYRKTAADGAVERNFGWALHPEAEEQCDISISSIVRFHSNCHRETGSVRPGKVWGEVRISRLKSTRSWFGK